jgi:fatty acid hydroxylase family protein
MLFVYRHRIFNIPLDSALSWLALFLGIEFSYYVHHVAMHNIRWFWAIHAVHHSPTKLNLSAGARIGWGGHLIGGFVFYLVAVGFHPALVFGMLALGLVYQFVLHLFYPPHLGALKWVLNTPRHHQVHHAVSPTCIDKNFGSVLIVFDRIFVTFADAPRDEALQFGLRDTAPATNNPLKIVFRGWAHMFSDTFRAELNRNEFSGNKGSSVTTAVTFEYEFSGKWLQASVVLQDKGNGIHIAGINVIPLPNSLENTYKFTLNDKPAINYIFLAATCIVPIFILVALIVCIRTPIPRKKWLWVIFILFGFMSVHLNWTDSTVNINPLYFNIFGAGFMRSSPYSPVILTVSFPLGAILFFLKRRKWISTVSPPK